MSHTNENQKLLSEKQLASLSYQEPPNDFADRVMSAITHPKIVAAPKPKPLLWLSACASAFALGLVMSPLLRAKESKNLQLQAVTQPIQIIALPTGDSNMIPVKTTLGALGILGALFSPTAPSQPEMTPTLMFCKDAVASCEREPHSTEACEQIFAFCLAGKPKKETTEACKEIAPDELNEQQDELNEQQDELNEQQDELNEQQD